MAAFLGEVGGSEIDGDALGRQRQPDGIQRAAHPLAALGHGLIREPDNGEAGEAGPDLDLHVDGARFDPFESDRRDPREHRRTPVQAPITLAKAPSARQEQSANIPKLWRGNRRSSDLVLGQSAKLSQN